MYPVSEAFLQAVQENTRRYYWSGRITTTKGATHEFAWRSIEPGGGAQIDLVIKRKDGVSNLCEMKFTNEEYSIDEDEHRKIENRLSRFQTMTETKDAIHVTLICGNGYKRSKYSGIVQNVIVGDDLFT